MEFGAGGFICHTPGMPDRVWPSMRIHSHQRKNVHAPRRLDSFCLRISWMSQYQVGIIPFLRILLVSSDALPSFLFCFSHNFFVHSSFWCVFPHVFSPFFQFLKYFYWDYFTLSVFFFILYIFLFCLFFLSFLSFVLFFSAPIFSSFPLSLFLSFSNCSFPFSPPSPFSPFLSIFSLLSFFFPHFLLPFLPPTQPSFFVIPPFILSFSLPFPFFFFYSSFSFHGFNILIIILCILTGWADFSSQPPPPPMATHPEFSSSSQQSQPPPKPVPYALSRSVKS